MAEDLPSLQQTLRDREDRSFVGRTKELNYFRANLRLPGNDPSKIFVTNIYGDAGVGKTFLAQQLRRIADSEKRSHRFYRR